ncbi:zinc-finger-containing protein [Heyndrickxia sporothermodurans]|uniref:zinc-finger-containing protein n=1 Tax=Heyndrickxia sporothermodurans TaxID=46224 RepID=UPI000D360BF0|nr:zinc-finger-containing protein [Heyndrickxia sporothermodurans]PTY92933.1 hypothetical protein B5V90_02310 [Heyndrickxia sporothermodurans]
MICPYCNNEAEFMTTEQYYGRDYGTNIYVCRPCDATVGTHGRTKNPKGSLANKKLRELRIEVHSHFDKLWKERGMKRTAAYQYLQEIMEIPKEEAHIGMFDEERCLLALDRLSKNNPQSPMKVGFKNRGHFCNYCRKILENKCGAYSHHTINPAIWYVWKNRKTPGLMNEFLENLKATKFNDSVKEFNSQLRRIAGPFKNQPGYGTK